MYNPKLGVLCSALTSAEAAKGSFSGYMAAQKSSSKNATETTAESSSESDTKTVAEESSETDMKTGTSPAANTDTENTAPETKYITIDLSTARETHPTGDAAAPFDLKIVSEEENGIDFANEWYDRKGLSLPMIGTDWNRAGFCFHIGFRAVFCHCFRVRSRSAF